MVCLTRMKKKLCLAALVTVCACSRRPPPPPTQSSATPTPEVTPHSQPLQVGPPPPRPPRWKVPDFQLPTPDLRLPELPRLRTPEAGPWTPPPLDPSFARWHWQSFAPSKIPEMSRGMDQDFSAGALRFPRKDVYSDLSVPGVGGLRGALDDYEAQQKAQREKYVPFPIPTSFSIPF